MAVDIVTIGIEYDTSGLDKGTRAQDKAAQSANKMADSLGGAEKSTKAVTQATNYYASALQAAAAAMGVSKIIDQIDQYTKFTSQLKLATGSTQEYASSLNAVRQISKDAQSSLAGTGTLYAKIANGTRELGVAQSQVAKITESVNLALKVSGATATEAASAQLQLGQAFASGVLRGEEFNAVNEAAPRLMKALADGMGVPIGALKDMASNGLITSEIMARVLPKALEDLREEAKSVQTISGSIQVLKNNMLEFIGVQSQASGVVSVITGGIGLLADNLALLAGAILTITATKFANFLSGMATATYESVAANRALAAANLATAQSNVAATASTVALADARVLSNIQAVNAAAGTSALAIANVNLTSSQARAAVAGIAHTEALAAQAVAAGAASTAMGVLRGAVAFLGGPIGAIITVLGIAATAWSVFGNKAKEANETAASTALASGAEILKTLEAQNQKLRERIALSKAGNPEAAKEGGAPADKLSATLKEINALKAKGSAMTGADQIQLIEVQDRYARISKELKTNRDLLGEISGKTASEKMAKWFGENGSAAQRMAAALAEAKKEVGELTPEMEKLIKAKFADKSSAEKDISDSMKAAIANAKLAKKSHHDVMKAIDNDSEEFAKNQIALSKKTTKEIIDGIREQDKNYAAYNKSLDAHALKMDEINTLAKLEIDTLGMSAVQRNTLIEQKKIDLALEREIAKIRGENIEEGMKQTLVDKATTQANIDKSTAQLRAEQGEWTKFYGEIYNGLSDSLYRGFESGKGFGKSFLDSIKNLFKTNVLKIAVQAVMGSGGSFVSSLMSAFGGSGGAAGAAGSGGGMFSNGMSLISAGKTLWQGFSAAGGGMLATAGSTIASGGSALGLTSVSQFGTGMTAGTGAFLGQGATVAGSATGTGALASSAGAAGASSVSWIPIAGWIAAGMMTAHNMQKQGWDSGNMGGLSNTGKVLGSATLGVDSLLRGLGMSSTLANIFSGQSTIARIFGRKAPEVREFGLEGNLSAGGLAGNTYQNITEKGGWFRSDKNYTKTGAIESSTQKMFNESMSSMMAASKGFGAALGVDASVIDGYSKQIKMAFSSDEKANQEQVAKLFGGIADELSLRLIPSLSSMSKDGESASQTLQRLSVDLTEANSVMKALGQSTYAVSVAGANGASKLIDLFGGLQNLQAISSQYYDNFYTDAEKLKLATSTVKDAFAAAGQTMPATRDALRAMIETAKAAGDDKTYASLMKLSGAFASIISASDAAAVAIQVAAESARAIAEQRAALQKEYNDLTMTSAQIEAQRRSAIDASNLTLYDSIQATKQKQAADIQAAESARALAGERASLQDELDNLTMTEAELIAKKRKTYNEQNRDIFDQIQAEKDKAKQMQASAQAASQAQEAANRIRDAWQGLTDSVFDEVRRIRGLTDGNAAMGYASAQSAFTIASAKASAGDQAAYKSLPELSKALLSIAEQQAPTLDALRLIQAQTAASLLATAGKLGYQMPSFAVGTNYVPQDMIAQIHNGGMIVPAAYNPANGGTSTSSDNAVIRDLTQRLEMLSFELRSIAGHTSTTARILDRAFIDDKMQIGTPDNDPIEVRTVV